jgi:hypothetical protein
MVSACFYEGSFRYYIPIVERNKRLTNHLTSDMTVSFADAITIVIES